MKEYSNYDNIYIDPSSIFKKIKGYKKSPRKSNILIIGDTPLDVYWICKKSQKNFHQKHITIINQEQYDVSDEIKRPGTVYSNAKLLTELGFSVSVITCVDDDEIGNYIRSEYEKLKINLVAPIIKGASFQRHYILIDSEEPYKGSFSEVQRVNHEPKFDSNNIEVTDFNSDFSDVIEKTFIDSEYILINDTHKGTLTWNDRKESKDHIKTSFIFPYLLKYLKKLNKKITILDCRKSIEHYKEFNICFLTSSSYETAVSLGCSSDELTISEGGGYFLNEKLMEKLFKEYPNIDNWALTRGSQGVQTGQRKDEEWTIQCTNLPPFINLGNTINFTPHCGDFFNVGLLYGIVANMKTNESIAFGSLLGGLQANKKYAKVLTGENIFDFIENDSNNFANKIHLEKLTTIRDKAMLDAEVVINYLKNVQPVTKNNCIKSGFLACYPKGPIAQKLDTLTEKLISKDLKSNNIRLILITGEQGVGKSEFAKSLAYEIAISKGHLPNEVFQWLNEPLYSFDAVNYITSDEKLLKLIELCKPFGVLFLDEIELDHGSWLLGMINDVLNQTTSDLVNKLNGMNIIVAGSSLINANFSVHPWKDVKMRSADFIKLPSYKESYQDIALLFLMMFDWTKGKTHHKMIPKEVDTAVLLELMLLFKSNNIIFSDKQNYYLLKEIFDIIDMGKCWANDILTRNKMLSVFKDKMILNAVPFFASDSIKLDI